MSTTAEIREAITHELKCHPEPFQAVKRGDKTFEWRKDDRDYRVGDTIRLCEWLPGETEHFVMAGSIVERTIGYTGEEIDRRVTYIIREGFGIPEGYCIMGLTDMEREGEAVAWMDTRLNRFATIEERKSWEEYPKGRSDSYMKEAMLAMYSTPLYTHPSPTTADVKDSAVDVQEVVKAGEDLVKMLWEANDMACIGPVPSPGWHAKKNRILNQWTNATKPFRP